ncbi:glutamate-ammonia-ligase adenylyltransferase [Paenibacillus sp. TCA20]|uniref:thioredoxin-dependent thiol peroxidase n=1 Tax=Paenibacillus sp. TCA20 TaxID=1499968 RepID=UPI0004D99BB5|nr:thioredoxin-dependent thiol peroxidase [Paenibacillus sp. TCA20]GAK40501.1 glutamate-ammonia-ligase adenylyltransferase [Paenibacillus sp. TCA20]
MELTIGAKAPDFVLERSGGQKVRLSDYRGKRVVLYFYPKDMTASCTDEACQFRDAHASFSTLNTVILGVSTDPASRHDKFITKYELPFTLLSDEDHQVSELYGVWQLKKLYGKEYMGIVRSTFLIDEEGILVKEWRKVKVKGHIDDALAFIQTHMEK